jgi:hypothetical protein
MFFRSAPPIPFEHSRLTIDPAPRRVNARRHAQAEHAGPTNALPGKRSPPLGISFSIPRIHPPAVAAPSLADLAARARLYTNVPDCTNPVQNIRVRVLASRKSSWLELPGDALSPLQTNQIWALDHPPPSARPKRRRPGRMPEQISTAFSHWNILNCFALPGIRPASRGWHSRGGARPIRAIRLRARVRNPRRES